MTKLTHVTCALPNLRMLTEKQIHLDAHKWDTNVGSTGGKSCVWPKGAFQEVGLGGWLQDAWTTGCCVWHVGSEARARTISPPPACRHHRTKCEKNPLAENPNCWICKKRPLNFHPNSNLVGKWDGSSNVLLCISLTLSVSVETKD